MVRRLLDAALLLLSLLPNPRGVVPKLQPLLSLIGSAFFFFLSLSASLDPWLSRLPFLVIFAIQDSLVAVLSRSIYTAQSHPVSSRVQLPVMEFEEVADSEQLFGRGSPLGPIDAKKARFPCCIVWTPLPLISWLVPFIGHIGICREDGVILDFAGPHFVSVDHFNFGSVTRYIQLSREECSLSPNLADSLKNEALESNEIMTWDDVLRKSTQDFQHRSYSLFTCNCHCFVANCLNRLSYGSRHRRWNVVNLAVLMFFRGTWVDKIAVLKSFLPFAIVLCLGLLLGGTNFFVFLGGFALALVGWFLIGTYCFKSLVLL